MRRDTEEHGAWLNLTARLTTRSSERAAHAFGEANGDIDDLDKAASIRVHHAAARSTRALDSAGTCGKVGTKQAPNLAIPVPNANIANPKFLLQRSRKAPIKFTWIGRPAASAGLEAPHWRFSAGPLDRRGWPRTPTLPP